MSTPFLSVIVPTMRAGGITVLLDALAAQTETDFELVLVDALYPRRHKQVKQAAWERFIRLVHVDGSQYFPVASFCAMANAGLRAATGEVAVFMVDYSRPPPDCLARHAAFHRTHGVTDGYMAPHRYIHLDVDPAFPRYGRDEIDRYADDVRAGRLDRFVLSIGEPVDRPAEPFEVDGKVIAQSDADPKLRIPPGPIDSSFFHAKNESVRLSVARATGWDEDLDGSHGWQDSDFAERLPVRWTLDPVNVLDIANPRGVFPFAKRTREFGGNEKIWKAKTHRWQDVKKTLPPERVAAAGKWAMEETERMNASKLRVAMIYGEFSTAIHGPFDIAGLYTRQGLTGSESSFFNLARTLAERGHEIVVFCVTPEWAEHESGFVAVPIDRLENLSRLEKVDAVIAWNEPDYLQFAPKGALRICDQQLNDFGYAGGQWYRNAPTWLGKHGACDWRSLVDVWVSPSKNHADNVMRADGLTAEVIPNSVDMDLFAVPVPDTRNPHRAVYCSSPDRGLHHLLGMWPAVRAAVPDAELRIFYRLEPWLAAARDNPDEVGRRARYIEAALPRLLGHGVTVCGPVPNAQMARELQAAAVLAYPCDPVRYTEGFGCSVLDAASAGCLPLISNADALPEVHGAAAGVISGRPGDARRVWIDRIVWAMTAYQTGPERAKVEAAMQAHAQAHAREVVTAQWERLIGEARARTTTGPAVEYVGVPV